MSKSQKPSELEEHLGYWLRLVSNHVSHAFRVKVEAHGVTVAEWVVLRALFDVEGVRPSELADRLGLTRGAVSKLVDRLVAKELATTRSDRGDRRSQLVALTTSGRRLVPVLAALADENDAEVFGHLDRDQRVALRETLVAIARRNALEGVPTD